MPRTHSLLQSRVDVSLLRYTGPGYGALYSLSQLSLAGCTALTDRALVAIARMCPNLRSLSLAGCSQSGLTSGGLAYLALHCTQLEQVRLGGCSQLTSTAVLALAENCPQLQVLTLVRCGRVRSPHTLMPGAVQRDHVGECGGGDTRHQVRKADRSRPVLLPQSG